MGNRFVFDFSGNRCYCFKWCVGAGEKAIIWEAFPFLTFFWMCTMKKELVDFLRQIKIHPSLRSLGEIQTKSGIIEPILRYLGWECKTGRNACMTPSYEQEISANLERAVSNEKTS